MSRKRRRVTGWIDWSEVAELFEPERSGALFADLAAPRRVRVYAGLHHTTLKAVFAGQDALGAGGGSITLRIAKEATP